MGVMEETCQHRPVQYLNNVLEQDHRTIKRSDQREPAFPLVLVCAEHHRRLRSDSNDSQRPGVRKCGGCEGRSTAPLHSRAVRGDELNYRSSTPTFGSTTKLQHIPFRTIGNEAHFLQCQGTWRAVWANLRSRRIASELKTLEFRSIEFISAELVASSSAYRKCSERKEFGYSWMNGA
jgi:hypothetical protein